MSKIYTAADQLIGHTPLLEQFGTNCLRMGRRLQEGFVVTDEPGKRRAPPPGPRAGTACRARSAPCR